MPSEWDRLADLGLIDRDVRLDRLTTYKMGGPARWFAEVERRRDLGPIVDAFAAAPVPVLVLGRGSNVVVADSGFEGLVIHLGGELATVEIGECSVDAGGGAPLARLARSAVKAGRLGLEFLVGIPGSVGGAVRQNAGCLGSEMRDWLIDATVLDLASGIESTCDPAGLHLDYRSSSIRPVEVVLGARFRFRPGPVEEGEERLLEVTRWRREHQPGGTLNAGSVFKNPPGEAAGRIIDEEGLKGLQIGRVAVSTKHANFFVAEQGATAAEVYRLVDEVRRRVRERRGVDLQPEIQFVGDFEGAA